MEHNYAGERPPARQGGYLPIEEHGIVGDLRTVALIGTDGTVDWFCPARFDAPSLFGAILDSRRGGYFSLTARTNYARPKQRYLHDTNILLTRFQGKEAVGEVIDFMVPETRTAGRARDLLVRQARAVRGRARFEVACHPAFDYGRMPHATEIIDGTGAVFTSPLGRAVLRANVGLKAEDNGVAGDVHAGRGRDGRLSPGVERRCPPGARGRDPRAVHPDAGLLAQLAGSVALHGPLARGRAPLRAGAQAAGLPPDRSPDRGPPRRCLRISGARATGTTATPGCGTPRSPCTR